MKKPWNKDSTFVEMNRMGLPVDNILSEADAGKAARFRRLMGPPFARKFVFDFDEPAKVCTKRMIDKIEQLRKEQGGVVELFHEFTTYAFDALSLSHKFQLGLHIAEYAYGGFFKGAEVRTGFNGIDVIKQATNSNVRR